MSAERDRQRERLKDLLKESGVHWADWETVDRLMRNGVSVELPPEPEVKPGTTGWVAIAQHFALPDGRYRAIARDGDFLAVSSDGRSWVVQSNVTDFVPDPEPLTTELVAQFAEKVRGAYSLHIPGNAAPSVADRLDNVERAARDLLAPYVAGGAR